MTHQDFNPFYARIAPIFWPILWLHIQRICAWHEANGAPGVLLDFQITWWGRVQIVRIVKADEPALVALRAYKECTADWCLDWLTLWSGQFTRLSKRPRAALRLITLLAKGERATAKPPLEPG